MFTLTNNSELELTKISIPCRIISTQLPPSLTSYITVVDPYRIKSPAENLETETPLPLGAQLLVVYVGKKTYNTLKKQTDKLQDFYQRGEEVITRFKKVIQWSHNSIL